MLCHVGFDAPIIHGVQRYPLSNHLYWLSNGKPGGHKSPLSVLDDIDLKIAYAHALSKIDATDTLIAICEVN